MILFYTPIRYRYLVPTEFYFFSHHIMKAKEFQKKITKADEQPVSNQHSILFTSNYSYTP